MNLLQLQSHLKKAQIHNQIRRIIVLVVVSHNNVCYVFIQGGRIHLVPPTTQEELSDDESELYENGKLSELLPVLPITEGAAQVIMTPQQSATLAPSKMEQTILNRIQKYPSTSQHHTTHVYVPVGVAALLREYPTLLSTAVHAFCNRDQSDKKTLRVMKHFPPEQRVTTAVRFSRALYARLHSTQYTPDVRTGWQLPSPTSDVYKSHYLGVKIACGFELLVSRAGGITPTTTHSTNDSTPATNGSTPAAKDSTAATNDSTHANNDSTHATNDDDGVKRDAKWLKYKQSLHNNGYFRGELEGSKLHQELEGNALRYFKQHVQQHRKSSTSSISAAEQLCTGAAVVQLLSTVNKDLQWFKEREKRLVEPDDDSWMSLSPEMLDDMMQQPHQSNEELQETLQTFLRSTSDFEGIEVQQDKLGVPSSHRKVSRKASSSEASRKTSTITMTRNKTHNRKLSVLDTPQGRKVSSQSNTSNCSDMSNFSNKIDLNADSFTDAFSNCLDSYFADDDYYCESDDDDSSGLSSYGSSSETRKTSSGYSLNNDGSSRKVSSASSSGVSEGDAIKGVMKEMEQQLRTTTVGENMVAPLDSDDDEFDDVENFEPVKVDMRTVNELVKNYKEERGIGGPTSTLFTALGLNPK